MNRQGPIRLEGGRGYVLAVCVECPPWRVMADTRTKALHRAADHAHYTHRDTLLASRLRELAVRAHARDTPT